VDHVRTNCGRVVDEQVGREVVFGLEKRAGLSATDLHPELIYLAFTLVTCTTFADLGSILLGVVCSTDGSDRRTGRGGAVEKSVDGRRVVPPTRSFAGR
jgi:hypothetical protein